MSEPWVGVDLDGTLAEQPQGLEAIGAPVPAMVVRVQKWLSEGLEVRILTARASLGPAQVVLIQEWSRQVFGQVLPVTDRKDIYMIELWDDRAVRVEKNTGRQLSDSVLEGS